MYVWTSAWTHDVILHRNWWCHTFKTRVNEGILTSIIWRYLHFNRSFVSKQLLTVQFSRHTQTHLHIVCLCYITVYGKQLATHTYSLYGFHLDLLSFNLREELIHSLKKYNNIKGCSTCNLRRQLHRWWRRLNACHIYRINNIFTGISLFTIVEIVVKQGNHYSNTYM